MALNIKNIEVERLADEVARLTKETKTEAIRRALVERKARLKIRPAERSRMERLEILLRTRIWPQVPDDVRGTTLKKSEKEEILGFGSDGF
jgi:antitoxin VapB